MSEIMTKEKCEKAIQELIATKNKQMFNLLKAYEKDNTHYKVGDIIEDRVGRGEVISSHVYCSEYTGYFVAIVYECKNLTRKGTINKVTPTRKIFNTQIYEERSNN